jgi:D-amino peptidase
MCGDINAAIRGLRMGGPLDIDVVDGHGYGGNVVPEKLEPGARLVSESWLSRMICSGQLRDHYDGWMLLGQHSMAGTCDGFLSHTNTTATAVRLNNRFVGEIELAAWLAGHFDIPTILVTGDDGAVREATVFLPGIKTVVVKAARGRKDAECLPATEARSRIQAAAAEAVTALSASRAYKLPGPIHVELLFSSREQAERSSGMPRATRTNDHTISYRARDYLDAVSAVNTAMSLSGYVWAGLLGWRIQDVSENQSEAYLIERIQRVDQAREVICDWHRNRLRNWATQPCPFPMVEY